VKQPGGAVRKIVYSLAASALVAGCAAGQAAAAPPRGTVTGRAQVEGGPTAPATAAGPAGAQPRVRPLPGTVEFELAGRTHRLITATAGRAGTFSARLPPGTYRVVVRSPRIREQLSDGRLREQPCAPPRTVTVVARRTATVILTCITP
jgi:hypothetical protein